MIGCTLVDRYNGMLVLFAKTLRIYRHGRRFGEHFAGHIIPYGAKVEYHPKVVKDTARLHQFGKKVLPGILTGYAPYAGQRWKRDTLVADAEALQENRCRSLCETHQCERSSCRRRRQILFPFASGVAGKDSEVRTSNQIRQGPVATIQERRTKILISQNKNNKV